MIAKSANCARQLNQKTKKTRRQKKQDISKASQRKHLQVC